MKEIKDLTMGDYMDLFDAYKEIYNFEKEKRVYILPDRLDRPVSMRDMK